MAVVAVTVQIPARLQRADLLFVLVPGGEKGPHQPGWNRVKNGLQHDDPELLAHLDAGGNYGLYPAPGSEVLLLDVDEAIRFIDAGGDELARDTFAYSAWPDARKFRVIVTCPDYPQEWAGRKTSIDGALEIFFPAGTRDGEEKAGGQCIGPNSIHPNRNPYAVLVDLPIKEVAWQEIATVADALKPDAIQTPPQVRVNREPGNAKLLKDRYDLQLEWPRDPYPSGEEIRGASPFHDSSTGANVTVNLAKGVFYCFRHGVGYDAAGCEALRRGIIECGDPFDQEAFQKLAAELEQDFPEVGYFEKVAYRRKMQAARRQEVST